MTISQRIKYLRKNILNLTQDNFSEKIGLSRSNIANIEVSRIKVTDRTIKDICRKFNINKEWLLHGTGEIEKNNRQTALEEITKKYTLNDMETKFIKLFLTLNNKDKDLILDLMKRISDDK